MKKEPIILANLIKTLDGTILQSFHRHDYKKYVDKNRLTFMVDGGTDYLRRGVGFEPVLEKFSEKEISLIKEKNLTYNPVSGRFSDVNGYRDTVIGVDGYRVVNINKKKYKAHRLVFLMSGLNLENKEIDHINNIRIDNNWLNLRVVTKEQNQANSLLRKDSTTKIKGLSFHKVKNKWIGRVQHNKKRYEVSSVVKEITIEKLINLRNKLHGKFANNGYKDQDLSNFYEELSIYSTDSYEVIRRFLCRGGRGKDSTEPITWTPLFKINDDWLKALIEYEEKRNPTNIYLKYYKKEKKYRKKHNISIK